MTYPITTGTLVFFVLSVIILGGFLGGHACGRISKDSASIGAVVTVISTVCVWLLWLCTWMHQLHPLISPEWKKDD